MNPFYIQKTTENTNKRKEIYVTDGNNEEYHVTHDNNQEYHVTDGNNQEYQYIRCDSTSFPYIIEMEIKQRIFIACKPCH
jgi:hypothetical protein